MNTKNHLIKNIEAFLAKTGMDYKNLSRKAGLGETYVRDIVVPDRSVSHAYDKLQKLAGYMGLTVAQLTGEDTIAYAPLIGYLGVRERIFPLLGDLQIMYSMNDSELKDAGLDFVPIPSGIKDRELLSFRVTGDYAGSIYPLESLLFIKKSKIIFQEFNQYIGKRVIAQLLDGSIYLRELDSGSEPGKFNLLSIGGGAHIKNASISALCPIYFVVYPE